MGVPRPGPWTRSTCACDLRASPPLSCTRGCLLGLAVGGATLRPLLSNASLSSEDDSVCSLQEAGSGGDLVQWPFHQSSMLGSAYSPSGDSSRKWGAEDNVIVTSISLNQPSDMVRGVRRIVKGDIEVEAEVLAGWVMYGSTAGAKGDQAGRWRWGNKGVQGEREGA